MKKIIVSICFLFVAVTMVSAQRAAEKKAEIRKGLKEQVMLTDTQVESVISIEDEFRPKLRVIKTDSTLSDAERTARSKALNEEKRVKLETTLGKETAQKVEAFYKQQKSLPKTEGGEKKEKVKIKTKN